MKSTSEEYLKLPKQPKESCPIIDLFIKTALEINRDLKDILSNYDDTLFVDIKNVVNDVEWNTRNLESNFEELRDQCIALRDWGQSWKDLAKELLEKYEPDTLQE